MAFYFNNASSNGITLADNAALTILKADGWTFSIWVQCEDRSGTINRRLFGWHAGGAANNYYILSVYDTSAASFADDVRLELNDDDGTTMSTASSSNPFGSNTSWTHVLITLGAGSTIATIYVNGSSVAYASNASFDDINRSDSVKFGNRQYDDQNWKGSMCEWAYWNRGLTEAEITALSKRWSPDYFRNNLQAYMPMVRDYVEVKNGIAVTNNGTTVVPHIGMIRPAYVLIGSPTTSTTHNMIGTAAVTFAGTAAARREYHLVGSAAVTFAGSSVARREYHMVGSAAVTFAGTAALRRQYNMVGSANVTFAGSGVIGKEHRLTGTAAVTFSGNAVVARLQTIAGSASVTFGGSANVLVPTGFVKVNPNTDTDFTKVDPNTDSDFVIVIPNP